jgi:hypothetical protein
MLFEGLMWNKGSSHLHRMKTLAGILPLFSCEVRCDWTASCTQIAVSPVFRQWHPASAGRCSFKAPEVMVKL